MSKQPYRQIAISPYTCMAVCAVFAYASVVALQGAGVLANRYLAGYLNSCFNKELNHD
jgi:activator of 2-hydroxyglutaryl-CoA dehydratase